MTPLLPASIRGRFRAARRRLGSKTHRRSVFEQIYRANDWGSSESASGPGSDLEETAALRAALPRILTSLEVTSVVDVPCGDFNWMSHVDLPVERYVGVDLVPDLIERVQRRYGNSTRTFVHGDVVADPLPRAELVFCRDLLVHLSFDEICGALRNIQRSGAQWLMTTTFTGDHNFQDIPTGSWRPLNLMLPPFAWPQPFELVIEHCSYEGGRWADKSMGVWPITDVRVPSRP